LKIDNLIKNEMRKLKEGMNKSEGLKFERDEKNQNPSVFLLRMG
jgi:hypothetical protein